MPDLEDALAQGIPLGEAASFFIRLRGTDKLASPAEFEAAFAALSPESRRVLMKQANEMMGMPLPAAGNGQVMKPPALPPLPATATGVNAKTAESEEDKGRERGRAATAAHFEREKHHTKEKNRELGGRLAGAVAGGAAAHFGGKKRPLSTLVGVALGSHLGARSGRRSGQVADAKRWEKNKAASAPKQAFEELGLPTNDPNVGMPPFAQGQPAAGQPPAGAPPITPPPPGGIEPEVDPETQAYLEQEQAADAEAEGAHIEMLRQKLQQAQAEGQQNAQAAETLQQTQAQHDATLQQMQAQVSDSFQQAASAQDQVLQQQQSAAAMRMAFQQLRGKVLELAASDPPTLSPDAQAIMASQAATGAPAPQGPAGPAAPGAAPAAAAPAGEDANQGGAPAEAPAEAAPAPTEKKPAEKSEKKDDSKVSLKVGAAAFSAAVKEAALKDMLGQYGQEALKRLPHAAAGAAIGAGMGAGEAFTSNEPLRQKVQQHEANPNRSYRDTMDLAQARARLTVGDFAENHPGAMMGVGALGGALLGAQQGPGIVNAARESAPEVRGIGERLKQLVTKGAA